MVWGTPTMIGAQWCEVVLWQGRVLAAAPRQRARISIQVGLWKHDEQ